MIHSSAADIAKAVGGLLLGDFNLYIKGVSTDSRDIDTSNLYIPLIGEKFDGHDFIPDLINRGVKCFIVDKKHERPTNKTVTYIVVEDTFKALQDLATYYIRLINPYVIAVTGSNGKTSAKDMLHAIMSKKYKTAKTSGNHNNEIGVPLSILEFDKEIKCAIIEMGVEHPGDINALCKIVRPNASLITCVGTAHIQFFNNSVNKIADAKLEIYSNLKNNGYMYYNKESKVIDEELKHLKDSSRPCFSFGDGSNLKITSDIKYEDGYTKFTCNALKEEVSIKIIGKHQATNALGCIGIGLREGISEKDIIDALKSVKFDKMRCDVVPFGDSIIIDDTYKSNPESVKAGIETLKEFKSYKKVACLSDMLELGDNEVKYHKEIGSYIKKSQIVDDLICTGELSFHTADKGNGKWLETKEECIKYLEKYRDKKAVILIKGSRATAMDKVVKELRKAK